MKKGQFSDQQIVTILQQAQRGDKPISAICREHGIAQNTFYRWRKQFGARSVTATQRPRRSRKGECSPQAAAGRA